MQKLTAGIFDRLVSSVSYITAGWGGLIVMIILYFRRKNPSRFVRFNVFQSIFISLLYFVLAMGFGLIMKFLSYIPFINYLVAQIGFFFNRPILLEYSLIQVFTIGLILYMALTSLFGKYPRIYWVSRIIDHNV